MRDGIKWTNLNVANIIKLFATKGIVVNAYIVRQLLLANHFVKRVAKKEESIDVVEDRNTGRTYGKFNTVAQNCTR